jgi:Fe-S-cluster containining protein
MTGSSDSKSSAPFFFSCQRSGNCCRVGTGHVWIETDDVASYAALTGTSAKAFLDLNVVQVGERLSLRERADGRCILLDGHNRCSIYEQRPQQCRSFPYWPELLQDAHALHRAAQYCPGIQLFPTTALCLEVLPQVASMVDGFLQRQALDAQPDPDSIRWGNSLEVDLYLASGKDRRIIEPELAAELGQQLQLLADVSGYPWSSAAWPRLLNDRKQGWSERGGIPSLS